MKLFNRNLIGTLLFFILINSNIIFAFSKVIRSNKSIMKNLTTTKDECEKLTTFNYGKFFVAAILRAKKSFKKFIVGSAMDSTGANDLTESCINLVGNIIQENKTRLLAEKDGYVAKLQEKFSSLQTLADQQGFSALQKEKIQSALIEKNPRAICKAYKTAVKENTDSSNDESEGNEYQLEVLQNLIDDAEKQANVISKDVVKNYLLKCKVFGISLTHKCRLNKALWDFMKSRSEDENKNFYNVLKETFEIVNQNNKYHEQRVDLGNDFSEINCKELPQEEGLNDLCVKAGTIINVKALWSTIANIELTNGLECAAEFLSKHVVKKMFKKLFEKAANLLLDIFGLFLFKAIKAIWNISVIIYYTHKAIQAKDNVDLKSKFWGDVAGAAIRLIIDMVAKKHKKHK